MRLNVRFEQPHRAAGMVAQQLVIFIPQIASPCHASQIDIGLVVDPFVPKEARGAHNARSLTAAPVVRALLCRLVRNRAVNVPVRRSTLAFRLAGRPRVGFQH